MAYAGDSSLCEDGISPWAGNFPYKHKNPSAPLQVPPPVGSVREKNLSVAIALFAETGTVVNKIFRQISILQCLCKRFCVHWRSQR